jgi:hypothetical protein
MEEFPMVWIGAFSPESTNWRHVFHTSPRRTRVDCRSRELLLLLSNAPETVAVFLLRFGRRHLGATPGGSSGLPARAFALGVPADLADSAVPVTYDSLPQFNCIRVRNSFMIYDHCLGRVYQILCLCMSSVVASTISSRREHCKCRCPRTHCIQYQVKYELYDTPRPRTSASG